METTQDRTGEIIETRREAYGDRAERRRDGLNAKADALQAKASNLLASARERSTSIPMGQPILVGHHSEGRDRRFREKIHNDHGRAYKMEDAAEEARRQAGAVGGAISSDDPEALAKLREQLNNARASQNMMIAANKAIRKCKGDQAAALADLLAVGMTEDQAREALKPDYCGRVGFPAYALSNNNANARRIEQRIKEIEANLQAVDVERELASGVIYREDVALNRLMFVFPGKPDAGTRDTLKRNGFRWAPSNNAWQRQLNNAGRWAAKQVIEALKLHEQAAA